MTGAGARRSAAVLLLAAASAAVTVLGLAGTAGAQPPDVSAWWNAANLGDPAPAPPAPPDVGAGDLLVQGSNAVPAGSPLAAVPVGTTAGSAPAGAQAVAGLSFDLAPGQAVGALTLRVAGTAPPQLSVVACRTTATFAAVDGGPWSQVPAYDAGACVPGTLRGGAVVFTDVARLAGGGRLAVVLLPGPLDRVVFARPGQAALAVRGGPPAAPLGTGGGAFPSTRGTAPGGGTRAGAGGLGPPGAPVAGEPGAGPALVGPVGAPSAPAGSGAGLPPVLAGGPTTGTTPTGTTPAGRPVRPAAAAGGLGTDARRGIGFAVIALEVLGFALLARGERTARGAAAPATAGGRLRPPDRAGRAGEVAAALGGVGRFRRQRQGSAPSL